MSQPPQPACLTWNNEPPLSEATLRFVREHRTDDPRQLALQGRRLPDVDLPAALNQIAGWQAARVKLPRWAATDGILYPARLSMEQCSSELTAGYKASLVEGRTGQGRFIDLTGGMGVDCAALAALFPQADYVERQEELCRLAAHNFPLLGVGHIRVHRADCLNFLPHAPQADWIFIDPARRDAHGGKTVALAQCEPDLTQLEETLLRKGTRVMAKLSPMLDLTQALHDLHRVEAAHVVAVDNECKELLLILGPDAPDSSDDVPLTCVNLDPRRLTPPLTFTRREEQARECTYASRPETYLYEPNASLLKAGAFRSVAYIYKVKKLHPNSHLYTSDTRLPDFPGRAFRLTGMSGPHKKEAARLLDGGRKANLSVRNFPATVAELRRQLKLSEGGSVYLFATTLADGSRTLLRGEKLT